MNTDIITIHGAETDAEAISFLKFIYGVNVDISSNTIRRGKVVSLCYQYYRDSELTLRTVEIPISDIEDWNKWQKEHD